MNSPTTGEEAARLKRQGSEQAIQLALESKWEEAAALNKTILATHPSDVEAWNRLGKSLLELGRLREAHEAYGHSVQLDPVNTIARRNMERLSTLVDNSDSDEIQRPGMVAKASQDLFIEEIGKTGVTVLRDVGLADLLDEEVLRGLGDHAGALDLVAIGVVDQGRETLHVAPGDRVYGVKLHGVPVGLVRLTHASELEQRLAEPVPGLDVRGVGGEDGAVEGGCFLPLALESELDGLLGTLALETRSLFPRCG